MNFRALEKSESWKSPEIFFWKKVRPCFQNATILLFNFHGGGHPKNLGYRAGGGGGGGGQEDRKRICDEEGSYELSIKYHEPLSNPIQNEQSLMRESS